MVPLKQSYMEVRAADVIAASKQTLDVILNHRKKVWNERVDLYVKSFNNSWWNKFFGKRINHIQAEQLIKKSESMMWIMIECISAHDEEICERFIRAAEKCNSGTMFLTISDMDTIGYI